MSLDDHKRRERAQAIGLFRYQLICPALDEGLSTKQRGRLVRQIASDHPYRPVRQPDPHLTRNAGSLDPPLPGRRV